ncbi:hypothetical protein V1517DRAFT_364473 [Lipomyces orientalis]|uniref:Uncharacterized protein n=1 Tax=Lipomyces orientalis TaxID=1233043 RepID=A0ACC3THF3_9ASCO
MRFLRAVDGFSNESKRLKLDDDTESVVLAEITKTVSYRLGEQRLDVQLPFETFLQLDQAFSELKSAEGISEDHRYPSLAYNSLTQTVTVVTCPSNIHVRAALWIVSEIRGFKYLSTRSPHTLRHISQYGATTTHFPYGQYLRGRKEADGGFIYSPADAPDEVVVAVEVGYSEVHRYLRDDKDTWINGREVKCCYIDWRSERATMSRAVEEAAGLNIQQGYYGALKYRDHTWAGELNEAFIEVWRLNSETRFASSIITLNLLGLRIRGFYPPDVWERKAGNIEDSQK